MLSNQCISCAHYRGEFKCDAFPRRIPQSILSGEVDHSTRRRGDHGITFEPLLETVAAAGQERWPAGKRDGVESPTDGGKYRPKNGGAKGGSADSSTIATEPVAAADRMVEALVASEARRGVIVPEDEIETVRKNWEKQVADSIEDDPARIRLVEEAAEFNGESELWNDITDRYGADHVIVTRKDAPANLLSGGQEAAKRLSRNWTTAVHAGVFEYETEPIGPDLKPGDATSGAGISGILRHEYGHSLWDDALTTEQQDEFRALLAQSTSVRDDLTIYAATSPDEAWCETFSIVTDPRFDGSRWKPWVGEARALVERIARDTDVVTAAGQERWPAGKRDGVESPTDGGKYRPKKGGSQSGASESDDAPAHEIDVRRSGFEGKLVDKEGAELGPDDTIIVYHATTTEVAEKLLENGFKPGDKVQAPPTIIDSEIVAKMLGKKVGDPLDYEPGRGQGAGLYVGPQATQLDQYGDAVVGIKVKVSDLQVPPERSLSGRNDPVRSLLLNDGYIEKEIKPDQVVEVPKEESAVTASSSVPSTLDGDNAPEQEEPMATASPTAENDTMTAASVTIIVGDDEETDVDETETEEAEEMVAGGPWRASLCIEGAPTEDGRLLEQGSISWRALPLSLMGLLDTGPGGHQGAKLCGRIDRIWREDDTIWGEGVFASSPFGQEVEQAVRDRMVDGVSVDLAILDFEVRDAATMAVLGPEEQVDAMLAGQKVLFAVTDAVIGMATVCPMQAIEGSKIEALVAAGQPMMRVRFTFQHPDETVTASASGHAPELPPADWFSDPGLEEPTPLTITDDGRVYGHAALWGSCHTAYSGRCVTPPRDDDYSLFHLGEIQTAEGDRVHVGQITMRTGHAPVHLNQAAAVEHYDHTGVAAADVRCGNDEHGIWVAGAVRPNLSLAQLREFTGAKVSGDWRRMQGGPWQMLGLLAVNIPGYPVPRPQALVASGDDGVEETVTVIAAGVVPTSFDRASRATIRALAARAAGGLTGLLDLTRR